MIVELSGSHYEMGRQHGTKLLQYRPALLGLMEGVHKKAMVCLQQGIGETIDSVRDVLSVHSPQTLDMISGIADGFEVSSWDILSMMMGSYVEDRFALSSGLKCQDAGCTSWAVSTKKVQEDRVILAKNRDYLISHRPLQVIFRCSPERGYKYLSVNSLGACNVFSSGMNSEGLTIADTRVPSMDVGPGLPRFSLMMHILENFSSVKEAIDYLRSVPRMGGGNLIFADAKGAIGRAEIGYEGLGLSQESAGFLVCTNHFGDPSMKGKYRRRGEAEEKHSIGRFQEVSKTLFNSGKDMDPNQAIDLMSFHGETFAVCNHGFTSREEEIATISSAIFLPVKRGFYYCEGFPCSTPYHWISFS
ncbi:MAG: C45 family autoproteolytic acyltransferase/hydrolase [Thermodesulfobacteriota bacterium]|nr:C45 family autoproteolytic acyltransferase/hydrolase [Thermodesulfobacteriota bacterium]